MQRVLRISLFVVLVAFLWQLYQLYSEYRELNNEHLIIDGEWSVLQKEQASLKADLDYFSESENLEKELRGRYNYKEPGEKLIIVVPTKEE